MNCRLFLPGRPRHLLCGPINPRVLSPFEAFYRPLSPFIGRFSNLTVIFGIRFLRFRFSPRPSACRCRLMGRRMLVGAKSHNGDDFRVRPNPLADGAADDAVTFQSSCRARSNILYRARPSLNEGGFSTARRLFCSEVRIPIMDQNW